jgi:hypothetical protein
MQADDAPDAADVQGGTHDTRLPFRSGKFRACTIYDPKCAGEPVEFPILRLRSPYFRPVKRGANVT